MLTLSTSQPPSSWTAKTGRLSFGQKLPPSSFSTTMTSRISKRSPSFQLAPYQCPKLHRRGSVLVAEEVGRTLKSGGGTYDMAAQLVMIRPPHTTTQPKVNVVLGGIGGTHHHTIMQRFTGGAGGGGVRYERKVTHREPARWVDIVNNLPDSDEFGSPPSSPEFALCETVSYEGQTAFERALAKRYRMLCFDSWVLFTFLLLFHS